MLDSQGKKSLTPHLAVGVPQEIHLPPSDQRDGKPFLTSRKRKRIDDNRGLQLGEPFTIQVCSLILFGEETSG